MTAPEDPEAPKAEAPTYDFELGDLVRLKSGGPVMTVYDAFPDGELDCCWFYQGEYRTQRFHQDMVEVREKGFLLVDFVLKAVFGLYPGAVRAAFKKQLSVNDS
jgi:uncharacterized protein YodC (DUF2158 family)